MSRILRRPMFRGGRVDSRGTGITSGLGYEKGGRVGYEPGGTVTGGSIMDRARNFFSTMMQPARNPDGSMVQIPKRNFAEDMMFVAGPGKFLKAGGGGLGLIRQMGKYPKFPKGYTSGKADKFVEETAPFLSNQYFKNLIRPYTSGMKELTKEAAGTVKDYGLPFGIGSLGAGFGLKKGYDAFMGDEDPDLKTEEQKLKELEEKQKEEEALAKLLSDLTKAEKNKAKDAIGGEEDIEINKEKYAKLLGGDKARGKDVTDMLLSFAGKALKPEADVKTAFGEFFEDEAKRPSRGQKIDDAAATLAINEYIAGKKSKAELDRFFAQADYKSSLTSRRGKKNIALNISDASKSNSGYKAIDLGLRISFPEAGRPNKMDASEGQTVDKVPLTVDNVGQIFIEDEAPYSAVMITIEDGQLIRDPLN
jgi:hypothetical protein